MTHAELVHRTAIVMYHAAIGSAVAVQIGDDEAWMDADQATKIEYLRMARSAVRLVMQEGPNVAERGECVCQSIGLWRAFFGNSDQGKVCVRCQGEVRT